MHPSRRRAVIGAEKARVWTAAAGLLLVLFLVVHLGGIALAAVAPVRFEAYAVRLHQAAWLPAVELALLGLAMAHLALGLAKRLANRRAGNTAALVSRRGEPLAALAARSQAAGGALLLLFLGVHLAQLRWPRPQAGEELATLRAVLAQPASLALYGAAALAVGLHLWHGTEAAHRSLGLLDPANGALIRAAGRSLALVLGVGFAAVALVLGVAP
ncbi:succinate dehydrogenase [Cyanobium sp. NIES-981]|uniref:succinate dehydrogenase n=1 Tax=Cyanobium sp. NIES-981 TaxID=1851505 RepID=UPI000B35A251|nr:succinate dehydrogenase [Cyanobium sp. NIES-981]